MSSPERRLAAILYADVVGYSRLMGADETGTLARLKAHRQELIDPIIASHHGRIVKLMGDGLLIEFASAVDAVSCAVEVQQVMSARNKDVSEGEQIVFRMAVNLGDIIVEDDDIYGDGVNIAARLEALAEPGSVYLSEDVYRQVRGKLSFGFDDLGEHRLKNIAEPVRVYRALLEYEAGHWVKPVSTLRTKQLRWAVFAAVMILVVLAGIASTWPIWEQKQHPGAKNAPHTSLAKQGTSTNPIAASPGKSSIAVLPFDNISNDPEQEYFVDGMTEDLITDLSKISDLFVIARNSVFVYKGRAVDISQVAKELGVSYVLEGSVRKAGEQIRVNAQLIDATSGGHLWAERYDRQLTDVFALQDEITGQIVQALAVTLSEQERTRLSRRYTDNIEAYDSFLQAQEILFRYSDHSYEPARALFRQAIRLDPSFARAYSALAVTYLNEVLVGYSNSLEENLSRALELTNTALAIDSALPQAYFARGYALLFKKQHDEAVLTLQKAIELDPNYADAYALLAFIYVHMKNRASDAFPIMEKAMALNPNYLVEYLGIVGQANYWVGHYQRALENFQQAIERNPNFLLWHVYIAAVYSHLGQIDDAEWTGVEIMNLNPDFSLEQWARERPFEDPSQLESTLVDLRQVGLE